VRDDADASELQAIFSRAAHFFAVANLSLFNILATIGVADALAPLLRRKGGFAMI
jgi:hypothetical protein